MESRERGFWLLLTITLAFTAVAMMISVVYYRTTVMWIWLLPIVASAQLVKAVVRRLTSVRKGRLGEGRHRSAPAPA